MRMFPGTKNRNEGTFTKTALLQNHPVFPLDILLNFPLLYLNAVASDIHTALIPQN